MSALISFAGLLLLALVVEPVARRLRLPFSAALVLVGFVGAEIITGLELDTGLRWYHFTQLILEIFLPVLVFASAFHLNARALLRDLVPILFLSVPVFVLTTLVSGTLIYLAIAHPTGFPWPVALLTGALLSATDPSAVVKLLQRLGASRRLQLLLQGESLFNDAIAIVLFTLFLTLAMMPAEQIGASYAAVNFLRLFFGGLAIGTIVGLLGTICMPLFKDTIPRTVLTLVAVLVDIFFSAHVFEFSSVMAVLATGLLMGETNRRLGGGEFVRYFWDLSDYIANALIFLLVGVTITLEMFTSQWLAMLIGIAAVQITRALMVYVLFPPLCWLPSITPVPMAQRTVLFWGGLRGAVTLALALSLPLEIDAWYTIQSIAYGVVLFTLFFQAPGMEAVFKRLNIGSDE